jgi:hypothetical protein
VPFVERSVRPVAMAPLPGPLITAEITHENARGEDSESDDRDALRRGETKSLRKKSEIKIQYSKFNK